MFGMNDARWYFWNATRFAAALEDLGAEFAARGGRVILASPPPYVGDWKEGVENHAKLLEPATSPINSLVPERAAASGRFLDGVARDFT